MKILIALLLAAAACHGATPKKVQAIYNSLDTRSIAQHLAFYQLYSDTPLGQQALKEAWQLLSHGESGTMKALPLHPSAIESIIALVNKRAEEATPQLDEASILAIDRLASRLGNRQLKGFGAATEEEVKALPTEEIDLCRGLLLSELSGQPNAMQSLRSYEAMIDLMALQILVRLPENATAADKVRAINSFVFEEQGFRFPPHSLYAKDIDQYTFLSAVLDSRRGVCLGVSILYICFAQRLGLPLEMVTPPGHIYVRCRTPEETINIETTARGINLEDEVYLGVTTKKLEERTVKEVIGMAHFNKGSGLCQQGDYTGAMASYKKAEEYMPDDLLLQKLIGYTHLFLGQEKEGRALLKKTLGHKSPFTIGEDTMAEDFVNGYIDAEGIKAVMMSVDETRSSIEKKRLELQEIIERHPRFRSGLFSLVVTWLQLHRTKEATSLLEHYCKVSPDDAMAHYYLAILHYERLDDTAAWHHLNHAEAITAAEDHFPKALKGLRKALSQRSPE